MDPVTGFHQTGNITLTLPVDAAWNSTITSSPLVDPNNVLGKVGAVIIVLIIIIGLTGNIQVLVVIARCPRLHRSYNVFIASLSATDFVFNALILPFFVDSYLYRSWRYPNSFCQFLTYFGAMMLVTSGLHIGLIAINRYFLIVHPRRFQDVSSRSAIACQVACVWVIAFVIVLPGILGLDAAVGYSEQLGRCNYLRSESRITLSVIFCVGFILPCAIMGYCYVVIWRTAISSQRRICLHRKHVPPDGITPTLDLLSTQNLPSAGLTEETTGSLSRQRLVLPASRSTRSLRGCRQTLRFIGVESLGLVQRETVAGPISTNHMVPPGSIASPGSLVSPGPLVSVGSIVSPGPFGPPHPLLSSGSLASSGLLLSPRPLGSPGPSAPLGCIVHPGPSLSPEPLASTGNFCKEPIAPSYQEAKDDPDNDGLGLRCGSESRTALTIAGESLDGVRGVVEPLYPHLIEQQQQQLPATSFVDCRKFLPDLQN